MAEIENVFNTNKQSSQSSEGDIKIHNQDDHMEGQYKSALAPIHKQSSSTVAMPNDGSKSGVVNRELTNERLRQSIQIKSEENQPDDLERNNSNQIQTSYNMEDHCLISPQKSIVQENINVQNVNLLNEDSSRNILEIRPNGPRLG